MNFEYDIFKKKKANIKKLLDYGFIKNKRKYIYKEKILDSFEVVISYKEEIKGKIIDLDFDEEYINYRLENGTGAFVTKVREKYLQILKDISEKCFEDKFFIFNQTNRINKKIYEKYKDKPIFKWENLDACVYENNEKWYGIIMNVDRSKITNGKGEIEVLNIKLDPNKIINLLKKKGYYKAYHMNKKSWISVILDDTLKDEEILTLIEESHSYTVSSKKSDKEWIMPINPSYFDVFTYFDSTDLYYWDKKHNFKKDDIVYLYITNPVKCIMYKCKIKDITEDFIIVKKECKYERGKYDLETLKKYGLTSVRSVRHLPLKLSEYVHCQTKKNKV